MHSPRAPIPSFAGLVDLARARLGAAALGCNDEFFAEASNLVADEPAIFDPDRYTPRGKWMDGWETRRRRDVGEDWAVVRLGARGLVAALDLDTRHFLGNHAPLARVDGIDAPDAATLDALPPAGDPRWIALLEQSPLQPGASNLFCVRAAAPVTHLRLTITPDGGVARLRAHGRVLSSWDEPIDPEARAALDALGADADLVDLAALRHGGRALACSDMFFSPMSNLIAPGRSTYMGNGWETRRRRGPGHDWILLELGAPGTLDLVEIDTGHFHGNHAKRCNLLGVRAPGATLADLLARPRGEGGWHEVLPAPSPALDWRPVIADQPLGPDRRAFVATLADRGPFTHLRLETFPDGGVARLRVYGQPDPSTASAEGPEHPT